ncbi:MAG: cytochrome ubiquinol oxidase subunit I [Gammaproteobacteria bacterium]
MELIVDTVTMSRLQFAFTALFHMLWPLLTVGLSIILVVFEALWLKSGDRDYYTHARFWAKLFTLNFAMGVVSGIPMEFQFGSNWAGFSRSAGELIGNLLGFDGAMALMLEAGFIGVMLFGWERVPRGMHLFATGMVALASSLSAFWIMLANGWMQNPSGGHMENGRYVIDDYSALFTNAHHYYGFLHMWLACLATSLFVVGGISAWYLLKERHAALFRKSFRLAYWGAALTMPLQVLIGDLLGYSLFQVQPAKAAAIEAHWKTNPPGEGAPWYIAAWPDKSVQDNLWSLEIPNVLSLLATHSSDGKVVGLEEFSPEDQPPALPLLYYGFRIMLIFGFAMLGLSLWTAAISYRKGGAADHPPLLLKAWVVSLPFGYLATEFGWLIREVGRQPWVAYGLIRTAHAASSLPSSAVVGSFVLFVLFYSALLIAFIYSILRWLRQGPDTGQPLPVYPVRQA